MSYAERLKLGELSANSAGSGSRCCLAESGGLLRRNNAVALIRPAGSAGDAERTAVPEAPLKIAICTPVPDNGQELFQLLAESAARLASGRHEVTIDFTCHGEAQRAALIACGAALPIGRAHIVERAPPKFFHANSVTHSRCLNALFAGVDADLAIICDYDMALVARDWDALLVDQFTAKGVAVLGSPYASDAPFTFKLPNDVTVSARRYQGKVNCMFFAFAPRDLKAKTDRLCDFGALYNEPSSIPLRFISNPIESLCFGLPVGAFMHLDTGGLLPQLIERHKLRQHVLTRRVRSYTVLTSARFPEDFPPHLLPEEYVLDDTPLVAHFRKGASKSESDNFTREMFARDVRAWIAGLLRPAAQAV